MFPRSLRFRLTLWYGLTLAAILAASGLFWHVYLSRELRLQIDERLGIIAEDVASFHLSNHDDLPNAEGARQIRCQALEDFIRRHNWGEYVQIVDDRGSIACSSSNLKEFKLPLEKPALQNAAQGLPYLQTVHLGGETAIRLLTYPLVVEDKVVDLIQVGESLQTVEAALTDLRLILLTFSPLALLAISVGGWFLAGRALSPVVRLTRAARTISADNLHQRLPMANTGDEIAQLAQTMNTMLGRLEESFNKVRQFTGDASHELRTPLAILKGETEVALRWAKDPQELRSTLESNQEEIDRMERILEDLLTLAKSEAGEMRLEIAEFSLSDLLQDLYLQGRLLGESKNVTVSLNLQVEEEIRLSGDQLQLRRMLLNLITNGVKYTPGGGKVDIELALFGGEAVVKVSDTGIGIPKKHLGRVFERFYRVDEARNREVGGTGLGLAIVKSIVEAHGGRIEVESIPEQGSTFTVYLPLDGPS